MTGSSVSAEVTLGGGGQAPAQASSRPLTHAALLQLAQVRALAAAAGRDDLVLRARKTARLVTAEAVPVAVLGEFKQGKSALVNALLRTDVCPVDADVGTAVSTVVRFGSPPRAVGHVAPAATTRPVPLDVAELAGAVTDRRAAALPRLESVEVFLDRALLRTGLAMIDTPGLGGLDSGHGVAALAMLPLVDAALFVTDAGRELTAPELSYLQRIAERCSTIVCVVTKTDLYADWRRVVDRDVAHLERAGLPLPVVGVSSFLRMRSAARRDRHDEVSGFPRLFALLHERVLHVADEEAAGTLREETASLGGQLRQHVAVEREAVLSAEEGGRLEQRLADTAERTRQLTAGSATWQVVLNDGVQDLTSDVEHDLRQRLLSLRRAGEARIRACDPEQDWADFEAWVQLEATSAAVGNLHHLVDRAEELARVVAERFDLDAGDLDLDLPAPAVALASVTAPRTDFSRSSARRLVGILVAARTSYGGGFVAGAAGHALLGLSMGVMAPFGIALTLVFTRRLLREDRSRELELRREQAVHELRRYLDEVQFVLGKDSRDAVRRTQRHLRDDFAGRAGLVHTSASRALAAARRGLAVPPEQRAGRAAELDEQWRRLEAGLRAPPG